VLVIDDGSGTKGGRRTRCIATESLYLGNSLLNRAFTPMMESSRFHQPRDQQCAARLSNKGEHP
jgi:hypothetical protein